MHKGFILLLWMFLSSRLPVAAQTAQIVAAQEHVAPVMTMLRTVATPLPAAPSFLRSQDAGKFPAHFSLLFAGAYEHDLKLLPPIDEVKTLVLTQTSLPLIQLWGGRLQLEAFRSTLHMQQEQLGPLGYGCMQGFGLVRQSYLCGPRSVHLSGLSLSFRFGRDTWTGRPTHVWRRMMQFVGAVLD
jgi:hypothetical protein